MCVNCYRKIKCVEKVVVFYIFLDNVSCEEFAM